MAAKAERAISGYPVVTIRSNAVRSKVCWITAAAKVYAVSKSPTRKAASWPRTTDSAALASATSCARLGLTLPRPRSSSVAAPISVVAGRLAHLPELPALSPSLIW
jgi:hypothetical protein